jgi:hypothetical protein
VLIAQFVEAQFEQMPDGVVRVDSALDAAALDADVGDTEQEFDIELFAQQQLDEITWAKGGGGHTSVIRAGSISVSNIWSSPAHGIGSISNRGFSEYPPPGPRGTPRAIERIDRPGCSRLEWTMPIMAARARAGPPGPACWQTARRGSASASWLNRRGVVNAHDTESATNGFRSACRRGRLQRRGAAGLSGISKPH